MLASRSAKPELSERQRRALLVLAELQAQVYIRREKRTLRKTFKTQAEAEAWRVDAQVALRRGTLTGAKSGTLAQAATPWLAGAASGAVRNRSGDVYKPSTIRG